MNLAQRISAALRAFRGAKVAYEVMPTWAGGQASYPPANYENNARYGYRRNELIYACIAKKASTASLPKLRVYDSQGQELPDHPLRALITRPNPYMTEKDLWAATIITLDLAGVAYWEKVRDRTGRVVQLWPLRPDRVTPKRAEGSALIGGYEYRVPGVGDPIVLDARDVLDFRLYDPLDMYGGLAPVAVAARVGDVDNATTDFLKEFFERAAVPPGLLKFKELITEAEREAVRAKWRQIYGGSSNWLDVAVLDQDVEYQRLGFTFSELEFGSLDARSEARICMVLRVPPILVGAKVGLDRATYSNYVEARRAWWEDDLLPLYGHLGDEVAEDLASEYGDVKLEWDFSAVPALREDRSARWDRAVRAWSSGLVTRNEARAELGLGAVGDGDIFIVPLSVMTEPAELAAKVLEYKAARNAPDDDERRRRERLLQRDLEAYFAAQMKRVLAEVRRGA